MSSELETRIGALLTTPSYWGGVIGYFVGTYIIDFLVTINEWTDIQYVYRLFTEIIACAALLALTVGGFAGWLAASLFRTWINDQKISDLVIHFCIAIGLGLLFSLVMFFVLVFLAFV
jgi:hypothetical protein